MQLRYLSMYCPSYLKRCVCFLLTTVGILELNITICASNKHQILISTSTYHHRPEVVFSTGRSFPVRRVALSDSFG